MAKIPDVVVKIRWEDPGDFLYLAHAREMVDQMIEDMPYCEELHEIRAALEEVAKRMKLVTREG